MLTKLILQEGKKCLLIFFNARILKKRSQSILIYFILLCKDGMGGETLTVSELSNILFMFGM